MAHIDSQDLAEQLLDAILGRMRRRYGDGFNLSIVSWQGASSQKLVSRIQRDSDTIRARLATGNFASNVPVALITR